MDPAAAHPDDAGHVPVLPAEVLELLAPRPGQVAIDCTAGRGGHSAALARAVAPSGRVIGFDLDPESLVFAAGRVAEAGGRFEPVHDSFVRVAARLETERLRADMLLADLGLSSAQLDDPRKGFSFAADGPLDMRYDPHGPVTAAELLATLGEDELADLIRRYGEDPWARKIARKLVQVRRVEPIRSTSQLARLVREVYGSRAQRSRMHPATRTFMALRIAVNDELTALGALLDNVRDAARGDTWLSPGARVAIISFHSLEDRLVKRAFAELARSGLARILTKRPVTAGPDEVAANPRARSAKLRAVRLAGSGTSA